MSTLKWRLWYLQFQALGEPAQQDVIGTAMDREGSRRSLAKLQAQKQRFDAGTADGRRNSGNRLAGDKSDTLIKFPSF
jgi:hypothetical protein